MSKIEVLRVPDEGEYADRKIAALRMLVNSVTEQLEPELRPALLAALLEDAGYEEREIVQANGIRLDNVFVKCIRKEGGE